MNRIQRRGLSFQFPSSKWPLPFHSYAHIVSGSVNLYLSGRSNSSWDVQLLKKLVSLSEHERPLERGTTSHGSQF